MSIIIYITLACLLISCVLAAISQSLLKSAVFLAFASAMLGVIMYILGARWAALIEVSACSGLITVIFISAISLSRNKREDIKKQYSDKRQMKFLPALLIILGIILIVAALANDFSLPQAANLNTEDFREMFWNTRQADILGQIVTIIIGGITVFVLFRDDKE